MWLDRGEPQTAEPMGLNVVMDGKFPLVLSSQAQPDSVWQLYKLLIAQKKQRPEFGSDGNYNVQQLTNGLVLVTREHGAKQSIIVLTLTDSAQDISSITRDGLHTSWGYDLNGSQLAANGLLILQTP